MNFEDRLKRQPMVGWYDLGRLFHTAIQTLLSSTIGKHSDRRLIQALSSQRKEYYDYTFHYTDSEKEPVIDLKNPRKEIWLDYVADTGEGWNSTYAVAYSASQPSLPLKHESTKEVYETNRGTVLVFGGDEVYPIPTKDNYKKRLIYPYENAIGTNISGETPHVFAIPGNHDWYDSLEAFIRLFCSDLSTRKFAGWWTRQKRSYFALKLPAGWWLLGSDGQLQSDMDTPQIEYFRFVAEKYMQPGDRVILCIAEPVWIKAHKYAQFGHIYDESDFLFLQEKILSNKNIQIKLFLAGDLHHYRRHEEVQWENKYSGTQKITAGGGGAFLHATHGFDVSLITERAEFEKGKRRKFQLKEEYPSSATSRKLCWWNLFFLFINPWFGVSTGLIYLFTAWNILSSTEDKKIHGLFDSIQYTVLAFKNNPSLAAWVAIVVLLFVFFTDTHSRVYKWAGGIAHCTAHYAAMFYITWGVTAGTQYLFSESIVQFAISMMLTFALGWVVGSLIMGLYLLISLNIFGRHDEEAFSALKIQDYKNFLRLHITADGALTIYPIKIDRVPRKWRRRKSDELSPSIFQPVDGKNAELIESPVRIE